jgi:hypothetical protein
MSKTFMWAERHALFPVGDKCSNIAQNAQIVSSGLSCCVAEPQKMAAVIDRTARENHDLSAKILLKDGKVGLRLDIEIHVAEAKAVHRQPFASRAGAPCASALLVVGVGPAGASRP